MSGVAAVVVALSKQLDQCVLGGDDAVLDCDVVAHDGEERVLCLGAVVAGMDEVLVGGVHLAVGGQ